MMELSQGELRDKVPPHNDEAECAYLCSVLLDKIGAKTVKLTPYDFYSNANRRIYQAIINLWEKYVEPEPISIKAELVRMDEFAAAGGNDYVDSIMSVVPSAANIEYYAKMVKNYSLRRGMLRVSGDLIIMTYDETLNEKKAIKKAIKNLKVLLKGFDCLNI